MLGWESTSQYIELLIRQGALTGMTFEQFLEREINAFLGSEQRKRMLLAKDYYAGDQSILSKKRLAIGEEGKKKEVSNLPNNKILDNRYAALIDQKTNYLFGQPFSAKTDNEQYAKDLKTVFSKKFLRLLRRTGMDAINQGIGWIYVYLDDNGAFKQQRFNPYEILPFWRDEDHTELDMVVRVYDVQGYEGTQLKTITRVEVYHAEGIKRYVLSSKKLIADVELGDSPYLISKTGDKTEAQTWTQIPVIPFKSNSDEIPLLNRVKSLQDALNTIQSNFMDALQEDARNTILVLLNYDGEELGEFRKNLATYGVVKVRSEDGVNGDVKTLEITVNAENYKTIIDLLRKAIISNGKGYDAKEERSGNAPNELNLKSMYSDIDLDANMTETEFQASFETLLWFYNTYCQLVKKPAYPDEDVEIIFNRDIMVSESAVIADIKNSVGILSRKTLVAQHPYVDDPEAEMKNIEEEEREKLDTGDPYKDTFGAGDDE